MPKTTTAKPKTAQRAAQKLTSTAAASRNGVPTGRMSEKTKQLTIRGFQLAYKQHRRKAA